MLPSNSGFTTGGVGGDFSSPTVPPDFKDVLSLIPISNPVLHFFDLFQLPILNLILPAMSGLSGTDTAPKHHQSRSFLAATQQEC